MKSKGVRTVFIERGKVGEYYKDNPTNITESLSFILSPYDKNYTDINSNSVVIRRSSSIIGNIMNSKVLMKTYSDRIVANCNNIASISFILAQSDYTEQYAIQSDGKTKLRTCVRPEPGVQLTWNQMVCI
ncbi:MAG: hypothetical protein QNJ33_17585 [Crocosphaera sp.]|nr:hypothetical protein [Crocosphaera sp.]